MASKYDPVAEMTTRELAKALADTADLGSLVDTNGRIPPAAYKICTAWTPMPFVESFAVKQGEHRALLAGIIRRNTGPYPGKLGFIGGKSGQNKTSEESLRYHWRADLGIDAKLVSGTAWHEPRAPGEPMPLGLGMTPAKMRTRMCMRSLSLAAACNSARRPTTSAPKRPV
jgi:hypothetical protein